MADDPDVHETGRVQDDQGRIVIVGTRRGRVTLRTLHTRTSGAVELDQEQAEEFSQMFVAACWQPGAEPAGDEIPDHNGPGWGVP